MLFHGLLHFPDCAVSENPRPACFLNGVEKGYCARPTELLRESTPRQCMLEP